jgi:hypothetical protein
MIIYKSKKTFIFLSLFYLLFTYTGFAQSQKKPLIIKSEVQEIVTQMEKLRIFGNHCFYYEQPRVITVRKKLGIETPLPCQLYMKLKKLASVEELRLLTEHNNSIVRLYAMYTLTEIKADNLQVILEKHRSDSVKVWVRSGCIQSSMTVIELFESFIKNMNN